MENGLRQRGRIPVDENDTSAEIEQSETTRPHAAAPPFDEVKRGTTTKVSLWSQSMRIFYWGTLMAQFIITSVSLTFLYCNTYFYPVTTARTAIDFGALLHLAAFCLSSVLTQYNFFMAIFVGPGFVPQKWYPEKEEYHQHMQYCRICEGFKAPRAHHCRKCGRCVTKMEHHCPWINNCVGHRNHAYFLRFLFFAVAGCLQAFIVLMLVVTRVFTYFYMDFGSTFRSSRRPQAWYDSFGHLLAFPPPPVFFTLPGLLWLVLMVGFALGVVLAVGVLFVIQLRIILKNETSIESWIINKANYYRKQTSSLEEPDDKQSSQPFRNPYNLGWKNNLRQVIFNKSWNAEGNGIWWQVQEGQDQFALTAEQLRQKHYKQSGSVLYHVEKPYSGRIFPVFSQGFLVCFSFPWTVDEPRISVNPGDRVRVTRFEKRWLYGEVVPRERGSTADATKGWFPRQVAIRCAPRAE